MKKTFKVLPHVAALSILAAFALPAAAQSAGSNVVNLGWFHLNTHDSSEPTVRTGTYQPGPIPNSGASVSDADTVGLAFTHFWTDNFALTLDAGLAPKFKLTGTGSLATYGEIGTAKQWSPALVAKWYFGDATSKFRPFIGGGVTYVWYSDVQLSQGFQSAAAVAPPGTGTATAKLSSSWAPVATVGATYNFDKNWSVAFSASYIPLKTNADITTSGGLAGPQTARTSLTLNPVVTFLSVGYTF